ncbi:MAG: hypothetical protein AAF197_10180 [Pseudomonadota bacterium]
MRLIQLILGSALLVFIAFLLIAPLFNVANYLRDSNLTQPDVPTFAVDTHRSISNDFAQWARTRVQSRAAENLTIQNISGTEWPMFSAVYYLWATEELERLSHRTNTDLPSDYASEAIEAAADLVAHPSTAKWVRDHWGETYLEKENLFYRMLLIAGLTSYQSITSDTRYETLLRNQVMSLSLELSSSPHGLLEDYPNECYPIDILPAIAVIKRAGALLGIDSTDFVARSLRGFTDSKLDPQTALPAYRVNAKSGEAEGPARGVGISYMLIWAPELWPETARQWYQRYSHHFWEQNLFWVGVREFSQDTPVFYSWLGDVDSGPIIVGKGVAASAFGLAAARINGKPQQAYALSAQAILASWPLLSGRLMLPRLLSDLTDAPYLGETALLFILTRPKSNTAEETVNLRMPLVVPVVMGSLCLLILLLLKVSFRLLRNGWNSQLA